MTAMPIRSLIGPVELARDIMSAVTPVTGTRATGKVLVRSKSGAVLIGRNWHLYPVLNGGARPELLFKVASGPLKADYTNGKRNKLNADEPGTDSWWSVSQAGTLVDITSVLGGVRHNLPTGTQFRFDPPHPDLEVVCVAQTAMVDGADPTWLGGCMGIVQFESLGGSTVSLDAFRSSIGQFPAVVIVWDGSEPADGSTQSSIARTGTRVGSQSELFKERFNLFVITKRQDGDHLRRQEGLRLLEDLTFFLKDRNMVDGQVMSAPTGVQVRGRSRIAGDSQVYQQHYIYLLEASLTVLWETYDTRTFSDWLLTRNQFFTHEKDVSGNRKEVVDQNIDMTP